MTPRHHPSAEILAAYSSGLLEPGFGLVVGVHVQSCPECGRRVRAFETISGEALGSLPPVEVGADALSRTLARLDQEAPTPERSVASRPILDRLPLKSRRWVAPGVWVAPVDTPHSAENRVYVLSVPGGMKSAHHGHSGAEFCTVLQGAYRDESGVFAAGDFAASDRDAAHQPIVEGREPCVCLFATEGRLKPTGLLGRLAFALADV
jgi:putative transcriptional regulator